MENEKLQLEIAALQQRAMQAERRIVVATNEEVQKITRGQVAFSRGCLNRETFAEPQPKLKDRIILAAVVGLASLFLVYLVYDLYRLAVWLGTRL